MDLFEFEGKKVFENFDIPIPTGKLFEDNLDEFKNFIYPCVIKAQVLSGKRGKAGGIKFADNFKELKIGIDKIRKIKIYDKVVKTILIEEKITIAKEFYLGITIDPIIKAPVLMFSPCGGIDIEEVAKEKPEMLLRVDLNEIDYENDLTSLLDIFHLSNIIIKQLNHIASKLIDLFYKLDITTVEINPLVVNDKDKLIAVDSKLVVDDDALFRQPNLQIINREESKSEAIKRAEKYGLSYVPLDKKGNIGLIAGGAGLAMMTVDTIKYFGGKPANFLDTGGGITEEQSKEALKILLENKQIDGIIINIFGGINNCEIIAKGIREAINEVESNKVIVVKSRGHSQEKGWQIFEELGLEQVKLGTTEEAVKKLFRTMKKGNL